MIVILYALFLEPLLVLIEYVPYGDLLGYLRKSRGLNDTYYEDPDVKPKSNLTSQQLMKFAWQIADGMSYLSLRKASIGLRNGTSRIAYKKISCVCLMICNNLLHLIKGENCENTKRKL